MVRQILPSRPSYTLLTQRSSPQQPTLTDDTNHQCPLVAIPTSWALPTHYQSPSINSPAHSLCRAHLKQTTRKCWSLRPILEIVVHAIYTCLLFGLPVFYACHISKISEQVDASMAGVKKSVLEMSAQAQPNDQIWDFVDFTTMGSRDRAPLPSDLKHAWDSFIDSMMRYWRMSEAFSVLLLSTIVGILQIQGAADDLCTRFSGLLSLICAIISFLCGSVYTIRFDSMRATHKAVEWRFEVQNMKMSTFWNVNILLAMPLIWLGWSTLLCLVCLLSFVWRTGTTSSSQSSIIVTTHDIFGPRIIISATIALGLGCFILIFTTFRRYGKPMDDAWNLRANGWSFEAKSCTCQQGSGVKAGARRRPNQ